MRFPPVLIYTFSFLFVLAYVYVRTPPNTFTQKNFTDLFFANGFFIFLVLILGGISFFVYQKIKYGKSQKSWESTVFDTTQSFNNDSLFEAYIRLGGLMLRKDQDDLKRKMTYMYRYFDQHFANTEADLMSAFQNSFQHPIDLNSIAPWLKTNLKTISQRSQLVYFLAGLSAIDGTINPREKDYLKELSDLLNLSKKDFDSIMAMYQKYEDAYHDQFKQSNRQAPRQTPSNYKREQAAEILGVSVTASQDEIKKAYRRLAKVHHPDRFATESEGQQKIAKERFVKIQLAYELLLGEWVKD